MAGLNCFHRSAGHAAWKGRHIPRQPRFRMHHPHVGRLGRCCRGRRRPAMAGTQRRQTPRRLEGIAITVEHSLVLECPEDVWCKMWALAGHAPEGLPRRQSRLSDLDSRTPRRRSGPIPIVLRSTQRKRSVWLGRSVLRWDLVLRGNSRSWFPASRQ